MGRAQTMETRKKISETRLRKKIHGLSGMNNPMWKDYPSYFGLHKYMRKHLPEKEFCEYCGLVSPYDIACVTGIYNRDFSNWKRLCRRCHNISHNKYQDPITGRFIKQGQQPNAAGAK